MIAFLIDLVDLYKYTQVDLERIMKQYESVVSSAQKGKKISKASLSCWKVKKSL